MHLLLHLFSTSLNQLKSTKWLINATHNIILFLPTTKEINVSASNPHKQQQQQQILHAATKTKRTNSLRQYQYTTSIRLVMTINAPFYLQKDADYTIQVNGIQVFVTSKWCLLLMREKHFKTAGIIVSPAQHCKSTYKLLHWLNSRKCTVCNGISFEGEIITISRGVFVWEKTKRSIKMNRTGYNILAMFIKEMGFHWSNKSNTMMYC